MLRTYRIKNGELEEADGDIDAAALRRAQWIDICTPSEHEIDLVEKTLDIEVTPVNEYEPFQVSSHFSADKRQLR